VCVGGGGRGASTSQVGRASGIQINLTIGICMLQVQQWFLSRVRVRWWPQLLQTDWEGHPAEGGAVMGAREAWEVYTGQAAWR